MSVLGKSMMPDAAKNSGNQNLVLFHCNSPYPASPDEMNLNVSLH